MTKVSAIIITKNEEDNIRECLESLAWVDEIIVVDSDSSDHTVDICRQFTSLVFSHDWLGYGPQKNLALGHATNEWVLSIDADERISNELRDEIITLLQDPQHAAYEIPRLSSYCGRFIRHGGWRPDFVLRLFRREQARFSDDLVHEKVVFKGQVGRLKNDLIHYSFQNLDQVLAVVNRYSTLGAVQKHKNGSSSGLTKAVLHGLGSFITTYFLKAGFLDGKHGFMLAVSNGEGTYYKYLKLMELGRSSDSDDCHG